MRAQSSKDEALQRLAYIEGHLKGIRKMVEEDVDCLDILKQSYAVQRAIQKFESTLLQGHLTHCIPAGIREGCEDAVVGELVELFELSQR